MNRYNTGKRDSGGAWILYGLAIVLAVCVCQVLPGSIDRSAQFDDEVYKAAAPVEPENMYVQTPQESQMPLELASR